YEFGEVIAVGDGRYTIMGEHIPMQVKVGDLVVLPTQGFTKLPFDGVEYYVGPENQILAKVSQSLEGTIEGVLAETEITKEDESNLTTI
nr:co-chaperone GroES [Bacteroidota bacterium]